MNSKSSDTQSILSRGPAKHLMLALGLAAAPLHASVSPAADNGEIITVSAKVSADYEHPLRSNGSVQEEYYSFGEGGRWNGSTHDDSLDKMKFLDVARTVAAPLAKRNYLPATDPKQVKLLIMVYWGATTGAGGAADSLAYQNASASNQRWASSSTARAVGPGAVGGAGRKSATVLAYARTVGNAVAAEVDAANREAETAMFAVPAENRQRDRTNWENAGLLGYDSALAATSGYELTALHGLRQELISDLEDDRYFVVLMAYDFPLLMKEKKHKLLWETRFSVRAHRHEFDRELPAMTQSASRFFGRDSHGIVREALSDGTAEIGELKTLGFVPTKNAIAASEGERGAK